MDIFTCKFSNENIVYFQINLGLVCIVLIKIASCKVKKHFAANNVLPIITITKVIIIKTSLL